MFLFCFCFCFFGFSKTVYCIRNKCYNLKLSCCLGQTILDNRSSFPLLQRSRYITSRTQQSVAISQEETEYRRAAQQNPTHPFSASSSLPQLPNLRQPCKCAKTIFRSPPRTQVLIRNRGSFITVGESSLADAVTGGFRTGFRSAR